jgi:NDP-sugar pyrophosphorylase family protein
MVHQVDHWTHIVRVNHLALAAEAEAAWVDWQSSSFLRKARTLGALIWQSRGWQESQILRSLSKIHPEAKVHPSAVVEASRIGPGVRIGPMAVVRNSVLGANTRVEEHATVVMSSLGDGCHVGRYGLVNMCTAWAGARISSGGGYQCCVFGRDSFIAWGATVLDLSFGGEVKVLDQGAKVSSGHHFMGAAIGHDACLGNGVRINHGMEVPCGSVLVAGADDLLRRWPEDTPQSERYRVHRGRPEPVKKG